MTGFPQLDGACALPAGQPWIRLLPGAETAGLMLEPMIWALALKHGGGPLHTTLFEQSNQLPQEIRDTITEELYCAGERELGAAVSVTWKEIDAAAYRSPSRRADRRPAGQPVQPPTGS
ncbi:hypothetical protein [Streptomyces decoyicus]|uniref:hypothetical protein n=1 Tax=Streptomyces decoyicus TaxID=249567 RepID=UPI00364E5086